MSEARDLAPDTPWVESCVLLLTSCVIMGPSVAYTSFRFVIYKTGMITSTLPWEYVEQSHRQGRCSLCATLFIFFSFPAYSHSQRKCRLRTESIQELQKQS